MALSRARAVIAAIFGYSVQEKLHETAWLDGVRGIAAFMVLVNHFNMEWMSEYVEAPFGATVTGTWKADGVYYHHDGDRLWAPFRLPFLRVLMISGGAQVAVFFVLSGIVLSWGSIKAVRAGNVAKLHNSLGSSVIRRWFRLFLPCIVVGFIYCLHRMYWDYHGLAGVWEQLLHFVHVNEQWANPFQTTYMIQMSTNNEYSFVMWTIPFEYGGSLFTYVSVLGLSRMPSTLYRVTIIILIALYACGKKLWGFWLFGFGIAISDYVQAYGGFRKLSQSTTTASSIVWWILFISAWLMLGWIGPSDRYTIPGYEWTASIPIPEGYRGFVGEDRFWHGWGGILLLLSAAHLRPVHGFYELGFVQYLGRLSFMLYLIHFFINNTISLPIRHRLYDWLCVKEWDDTFDGDVYRTTPMFNIAAHIFLMMISVILVFIVSNQLEIWVDRPCTNFGKWIDGKLTGKRASREEKLPQDDHQLLPSAEDAHEEHQLLPYTEEAQGTHQLLPYAEQTREEMSLAGESRPG